MYRSLNMSREEMVKEIHELRSVFIDSLALSILWSKKMDKNRRIERFTIESFYTMSSELNRIGKGMDSGKFSDEKLERLLKICRMAYEEFNLLGAEDKTRSLILGMRKSGNKLWTVGMANGSTIYPFHDKEMIKKINSIIGYKYLLNIDEIVDCLNSDLYLVEKLHHYFTSIYPRHMSSLLSKNYTEASYKAIKKIFSDVEFIKGCKDSSNEMLRDWYRNYLSNRLDRLQGVGLGFDEN